MKNKKKKHGGAREGSGRKVGFRMNEADKKEPTKIMRIPISLVAKVEKMIEKIKNKYG